MANETTTFRNSGLSKTFFFISIFVFVYWGTGRIIDVYRFAAVGAIYELLWLFMLLMLFALAILSPIFLIKEKFNFRSLYLFTFLISATNILLMIFI